MVWMRSMLTPIRAAVSRSWKVARMARPSLVRASRRWAPRIRPADTTKTNTRSGATDTGPSTSGRVGNGVGTLLATPPQPSSSAFCMAIHTPIITSITVSIDCPRSGRRSRRSQIAPAAAPTTIARGIARKKGTDASVSAANAA